MSKSALVIFSVAILVFSASYLGGQVERRAQKWEYGFIEKGTQKFRTGDRTFESKSGFRGLYDELGGFKPPKDPARAEDAVLQLLGQGGWELVTVDADRIYFKRPIS